MKQYVRPEVLVSYTVEELAEEAAVCVAYGPIDVPPPNCDPIPYLSASRSERRNASRAASYWRPC